MNRTRTTRLTLAAVAVALGLATVATATPAEAFRPIPGYDYPDLCKNRGAYAMPGEQTVGDILGGPVRYVDPEQEPNKVGRRDCYVPDWAR